MKSLWSFRVGRVGLPSLELCGAPLGSANPFPAEAGVAITPTLKTCKGDLDNGAHLTSLVITGRIETDTGPLAKLHNVHFTGLIPYGELPAVLAGWDVCMLPYVRSELTEAINPLIQILYIKIR